MNQRRLKRATVAAVGLLLVAIAWSPAARGEGPSKPRGVQPHEVVLDNGLTLLLVERHEEPMVSCGVFYDVGAVNDPAGKSGIAHLFEHMLFKGSRIIGTSDYQVERTYIEKQDRLRAKMIAEMNRMRIKKRRGEIDDVLDPKQWTPEYATMKGEYDELVEAERTYIKNNELADTYSSNGGAILNAGTSNDMTMYFVQLPANKLELFMWIESDRMSNGIMREFYIERDNVREERRLSVESTPTGRYREAFEAMFWQSHPYAVPVLGWASEVESITRDDVRDFYKIYYAPNNARVVIVGDFETDEVVTMARQYFGRIARGSIVPPPVLTEEPKPIAQRRFYAEAETNPRVQMRYQSVAIGHTDEAALDVLGGLLSGKTGRLYKRLVAKEDAAIGTPFGGNQGRKYAGYFEFNVTVKEDRTPEEVEGFILEELEKLRAGEIGDHELQKVKNQVLASSVRRLRSNLGLMFQLGAYDVWYDWTYINESPARQLSVTKADLHRVLETYFDPKTRTVAIYRTKATAASRVEDPALTALLATVPEDQQERTRGMLKRIKGSTEPDRLRQMQQMMEQGLSSGQMPEEQRPMVEYIVKTLEARIAELDGAEKEAD